jgi:hypothetical protein
MEAALISGLMFGAAVFFLHRAFWQAGVLRWMAAFLTGGGVTYLQLLVYRRALK